MRRPLSRLFLLAGLALASVATHATTVSPLTTPAPATPEVTLGLVPYRIEITRPNEVPQSATLLTAANTPVEFNLTRSVSYIKEACHVSKTQPKRAAKTPLKDIAPAPAATAVPSSACDKVDTAQLPEGSDQVIFTPGVITTGVKMTLTRLTDGEQDHLRIKMSNSTLESIRDFTYEAAMVQLPTTSEKASDQTYPVMANSSLVIDIGHGGRATITRLSLDGANDPVIPSGVSVERSLFELPKATSIKATDRGNDQVQINQVSQSSLDSIQSFTFAGASLPLPTLSEKSYDQLVPVVQTVTVPATKSVADCGDKGTLTGGGYAMTAWSGQGNNAPENSYPQGQSWVVSDNQHVNSFTAYAVCSSF